MSSILSRLRDFIVGSVCELYLLREIILIAFFCSLNSLFVSKPHDKTLKCGTIKELYKVFNVCPGRKRFSLFVTPKVRVILFDILSMCEVQFNVS